MQALYCCSGFINVALTASDQTLMVFIVAMGPFAEIILRSFLFMISPQIVLGRNSRLREAADPWVLNKHEKQSVFRLKAEWHSGRSLWGGIKDEGASK